MLIGVLDIQGDVSEHINILERLEVKYRKVRYTQDLSGISGLIIPGGESTLIGAILTQRGISREISEKRIPLMGTCAGLILISRNVDGKQGIMPLLDIEVKRNGYGSQRESFETDLDIKSMQKFKGVFIRAPLITKVHKGEILSEYNGSAVMIRDEKNLGLTFHPEIYGDERIHKLFIDRL